MNILFLLISASIALILLIIHSYLYRGTRITLNFFIFAFIWAFLKEGSAPPPSHPYLKLYEFLNQNIPLSFAYWTATIGWIFTFYISWCISEKILQRIDFFKNKIFSTLFICGIVIMGISYSIETTAINIGWWRWNINHKTLQNLFIGGYSLFTLEAWLFFTLIFLTAFFLIECSKYRKANWKIIFIILPFIYSWVILHIGPRMPTFSKEIIGVIIFLILPLTLLAFFNYLPFEYDGIIGQRPHQRTKIHLVFKELPLLIMLFMLSIVVGIDLFILKNPILLISALPVIFILLLSIKEIPFYIIFIFSLLALSWGKEKMIIPILPVIVVFLFWGINRLHIGNA